MCPLTTQAAQPLQGCQTWRHAPGQRALKGFCSLLHTPPNLLTINRRQVAVVRRGCLQSMQVLVWKTSIALLLQRAPSISSRWWAGCANSEYGSGFHIALAEAAAITTDEARPCTTPRQGPPAQRLENDFCTWLPRLPKPGRSTLPVLRPSQLPSSGLFCWCRRCFSSTLVPSLVQLSFSNHCPFYGKPADSLPALTLAQEIASSEVAIEAQSFVTWTSTLSYA